MQENNKYSISRKPSLVENYFRFLGVLSLGSVFLPILFSRLPSPFHTPTTYLLFWLFSLAFFKKEVLLDKLILKWSIFLFFFTILGLIFWSEVNLGGNTYPGVKTTIRLLGFFYFAILIRTYFEKSKDINGFVIIIKSGLFFILVTSITSIIGLTIYPSATRIMASGDITTESNTFFNSIGIGKYGFFASLIYLIPALVLLIKSSSIWLKFLIIFYTLILLYSVVMAEFTTALVLGIIFFFYSFFPVKGFWRTSIIGLSLFILIFTVFSGFLSDILLDLSNNFERNSAMSKHLVDVSDLITEKDFNFETAENYTVRVRFYLITESLKSFLETPFFGKVFQSGKFGAFHSFFVDWLAYFGLLGGIPLFYLLVNSLKKILRSANYRASMILSLTSFFLLGILTTEVETPQSAFSILLIVPGIFYMIDNHTYTLSGIKSRIKNKNQESRTKSQDQRTKTRSISLG